MFHGKTDLKIGFDDKVVTTPHHNGCPCCCQRMYVSQLNIIMFGQAMSFRWYLRTETATVPIVRTFCGSFCYNKSVTVPANEAVTVPVYISEDETPTNILVLFEGHNYISEVTTPCN